MAESIRMFQIYETDLAELERMVPDLNMDLMQHIQPRQRVKLRRIKEILSNVRWNYGPFTDVETFPADGKGASDG